MGFSTIPVVNMAGRIIGMIPKNFVIVLIENHCWYKDDKIRAKTEAGASQFYRTAITRQLSQVSRSDVGSEAGASPLDSPKGSISGSKSPLKSPLIAKNKVNEGEGEKDNNMI